MPAARILICKHFTNSRLQEELERVFQPVCSLLLSTWCVPSTMLGPIQSVQKGQYMRRCFLTRLTKRSFKLLSTLWAPDGSMWTIYKILNAGMQTARDVRGREQLLWGSDSGDGNEQKLGLRVKKWIEVKSAKGHGVSYGRRIKRASTERG